MVDIDSKRRALRSRYLELWPSIIELRCGYGGLSSPLLIEPSEAYFRQARKLMVIGQETNYWRTEYAPDRCAEVAVNNLLDTYWLFNHGEHYRSTFWQAVRELEGAIGVEPAAICWANLNRMDVDGRRPPPAVEAKIAERFPVLPDEIATLAPDVVVFFSGPNYDDLLARVFPNPSFESDGAPVREFSRVKHPNLPKNTFRTYHPSYLRRRGKTAVIIDRIKAALNGESA